MGLPLFTISKTSLCFVFSKFETRASIIFTLLLFKFLQTNPIFSIKLHGKVMYVMFDFFYQVEIWKLLHFGTFLGKKCKMENSLKPRIHCETDFLSRFANVNNFNQSKTNIISGKAYFTTHTT